VIKPFLQANKNTIMQFLKEAISRCEIITLLPPGKCIGSDRWQQENSMLSEYSGVSCSVISLQVMFAAQILVTQQTCRNSTAKSFYFSCPYHSTVRVDMHYNRKIILHQLTFTKIVRV
jgi:hypothetical protein